MRITKYLIGGLAALALVGCKDKMRELNTNPDTTGDTDPRYMFMDAAQNLDMVRGAIEAATQNDGVKMQYFVSYDGASAGQYCNPAASSYVTPGQIGYYYDWLYKIGYKLVSLQRWIDDMNEVEALKYQDLRAIAGILKIYEGFRVFQNYGAAVYSQAFKAITEGITRPEYDLFTNELYEQMDDELAGYIAVLAAAKQEGTVDLSTSDPIYGYKVNVAMGAPEAAGDYDQQRTKWKKFGNSYRLYMAWIMKAADPARFTKVLDETKASGWFESAADGAYSYQNGYTANDGQYNSDGSSNISVKYALTDNFVSYLKGLDDPRLPLLARANGLYADNKDIQWIQHYFPDSLENHMVYNKTSKKWVLTSWDGVFDFEDDPMLAYQGQSPNPQDNENTGAGQFWGQRSFTFHFYHPDYDPKKPEENKKLKPWKVQNKGEVTTDFPAEFEIKDADYSISIAVASRPQGRYFVAGGGKTFGDNAGASGHNGYDGAITNNSNIFFRQPLYTYPEFCFMMAYLSNEGIETGTPADDWFRSGVTAAMEELQADAIRSGVQVATNTSSTYYYAANGQTYTVNPRIVGINDLAVYSISDKIASYVDGLVLSPEAIVGQMWIYAYKQPIKMWDWWRLTGYPEIKDVATPADRDQLLGQLYWVRPYKANTTEALELPRRASLPTPVAANSGNWNAIRNVLLDQQNYGETYNETIGRIFWDLQGL